MGSIDPMMVFDEKLNVKFVNQNGAYLFGRKANQLIGRNIEVCDALGSILAPVLQEVLKHKKGISCDHEIPEEKQLRVFQGSYSPVLDENGKILGIFSVLREVTDRRLQFTQLSISNNRLKNHVKALEVFDVVSESDLSGCILYVNDPFLNLTKYSRSELIGKNYRIMNSGMHSKSFFQELWQTISRGQPWMGEINNRAKDGSTFWTQTIITPIFNEDGSTARFLSIQKDITREREERFKVTESALRFREMLDSNPLMEVSLDLEQNIVFCNATLLKTTGHLESELIEKNWFERLIPSNEKLTVQTHLLKLLGEKVPLTEFDSHILCQEGTLKEIHWRATVIKNHEHVIYGTHLLGENKKHDPVASNALRQDVLGFVSHELKGGLVSMVSGLHWIQDVLSQEPYDLKEVQSVLIKILKKANHVDKISRNMMESLERGSRLIEIRRQPVSLRTILTSVWNRILDETDPARCLTFDLNLPNEDIIVQWDPLKIEQVVRNLLINAIEYSKPQGGKIILDVREVNQAILMSLSDEGVGVPSESKGSIFELFNRGANSNQVLTKHFGIGLKLCKDIVVQHDGKIWIESKVDVGTTFYVLIPIDSKTYRDISVV